MDRYGACLSIKGDLYGPTALFIAEAASAWRSPKSFHDRSFIPLATEELKIPQESNGFRSSITAMLVVKKWWCPDLRRRDCPGSILKALLEESLRLCAHIDGILIIKREEEDG